MAPALRVISRYNITSARQPTTLLLHRRRRAGGTRLGHDLHEAWTPELVRIEKGPM